MHGPIGHKIEAESGGAMNLLQEWTPARRTTGIDWSDIQSRLSLRNSISMEWWPIQQTWEERKTINFCLNFFENFRLTTFIEKKQTILVSIFESLFYILTNNFYRQKLYISAWLKLGSLEMKVSTLTTWPPPPRQNFSLKSRKAFSIVDQRRPLLIHF